MNDRRKMRDEGKNMSPDYWAVIREQFQLKDLGDAFTCKGDEPVDGMLKQVTVSEQIVHTNNIKRLRFLSNVLGVSRRAAVGRRELVGAEPLLGLFLP